MCHMPRDALEQCGSPAEWLRERSDVYHTRKGLTRAGRLAARGSRLSRSGRHGDVICSHRGTQR